MAVKEAQKSGSVDQRKELREFLLLTRKLGSTHPNIIKMFGIKSSGSTNYVILECVVFAQACTHACTWSWIFVAAAFAVRPV